jgi:hypothetical protein
MASRAAWRFIGLLHNLPLESPVDTANMAMVPLTDARLAPYMSDDNFRHFVTSFRDQFGRKRRASALLARGAVRRKPEAVLAFRNALAIASVIRAWDRFLGAERQLEALKYSGYFDLYPYYLSSDYTSLVVNSASLFGVDQTDEFNGQTTPELAPAILRKDFYDEALFEALMERWRRRHLRSSRGSSEDESLFRSLEMAYRAARIPGDNRGSLDDYGANLALWCSALEILVWPVRRHAKTADVLAVLKPAATSAPILRRRRYRVRVPGSQQARWVTLAEKLYCEIYRARNAFMHGNPVTAGMVKPSGRRTRLSLNCYAPLLYKTALYTRLGLWETAHPVLSQEAAKHRILLRIGADALVTSTQPFGREARGTALARRARRVAAATVHAQSAAQRDASSG